MGHRHRGKAGDIRGPDAVPERTRLHHDDHLRSRSGHAGVRASAAETSHRLVVGDEGKKKPALIAREFLPNKRRYETDAERHRRIVDDLRRARSRLRLKLGVRANALFYPYGAYDDQAHQAALEAGHDILVTIEQGYNRYGGDPLEIRRFNADDIPLTEFAELVDGGWTRPAPLRYPLWQPD